MYVVDPLCTAVEMSTLLPHGLMRLDLTPVQDVQMTNHSVTTISAVSTCNNFFLAVYKQIVC